jgi:hypothetical protein
LGPLRVPGGMGLSSDDGLTPVFCCHGNDTARVLCYHGPVPDLLLSRPCIRPRHSGYITAPPSAAIAKDRHTSSVTTTWCPSSSATSWYLLSDCSTGTNRSSYPTTPTPSSSPTTPTWRPTTTTVPTTPARTTPTRCPASSATTWYQPSVGSTITSITSYPNTSASRNSPTAPTPTPTTTTAPTTPTRITPRTRTTPTKTTLTRITSTSPPLSRP